jgi:hypothetical protein
MRVEGSYKEALTYRIPITSGEENVDGFFPNQYQVSWMNGYPAVANNTYSIANGTVETGSSITP